jgi:hypothetical protein
MKRIFEGDERAVATMRAGRNVLSCAMKRLRGQKECREMKV